MEICAFLLFVPKRITYTRKSKLRSWKRFPVSRAEFSAIFGDAMESIGVNRDTLLVANSTIDNCPKTCADEPKDSTHAFVGDSTLSEASTHAGIPCGTLDTLPNEPAETLDKPGSDGIDLGWTLVNDSQETWDEPARSGRPTLRGSGARRPPETVPGFDILSVLGRGGMGVVYKAVQHGLKRPVALKMIRDDRYEDPENLARFQREAEALARLNHVNILMIYQIGPPDGKPFVALELLEGGTLSKQLAGTPQPFRESASLLVTLARAMHAAHLAGIVHRDLKPSNVLFDGNGTPKIADFGLAKWLEVDDSETRCGQVLGTPSYMAPEQALGSSPDVGAAADVYSLGAILYEMLTGRPPYKGATSTETLLMVQNDDPPPPRPGRLRRKLPFDLETICLMATARDPRKRYLSALALADDLERFLRGEPVRARRTPLWEQAFKLIRRRPATSMLVAACILGACAAAGAARHVQNLALAAEIKENDRIAGLKRDGDKAIFEAQSSLVKHGWDDVQHSLSKLVGQIEREPRLVDLHTKANSLLEEARSGRAAQRAQEDARTRFERFQDARDDALFLDTRFADLGPKDQLEATSRAARAGLGVFGKEEPGDQWSLTAPPMSLSAAEREEVVSGQYQLLLILADAVAQSPDGAVSARAERALRIVDQAARLRSPATRAYHLRRADYLEMMDETEAAASERAEAESLEPAGAFDNFLIGRALMRGKAWGTAIPYFNAVLQEQPDHFWAHCLLGICHLQLDLPYQARPDLMACLQKKPKLVWLYLLRGYASAGIANHAQKNAEAAGFARIANKEFDAAEQDYLTALDLLKSSVRPEDVALRYILLVNRGTIRFERNKLSDAAEDLREAIRLDDHHFDAFSALALVYQRQGRTEEALEQFTKAIAHKPDWAPLYRGRANVLIAVKTMTNAQRDAALHDLDEAIKRTPARTDWIAVDETNRAALLQQAGRDDEALAACERSLAIAPKHLAAHEIKIEILKKAERFEELLRACNVAIKTGTPKAWFFQLRGLAKEKLGDFFGATDDYTHALNMKADNPSVLCRRGWCYLLKDANQDAAHDFDAAARLDPSNADAYSGRGFARARLGQHKEAVLDAEEALKHGDPSSWRLAYNAARIYAQASAAESLDPSRNTPGAVARILSYQDLALNLLRRALQLAPAEQRVRIRRDMMENDPALQPPAIHRRLRSLDKELVDQPAPE